MKLNYLSSSTDSILYTEKDSSLNSPGKQTTQNLIIYT
jgi:hypothetical protein